MRATGVEGCDKGAGAGGGGGGGEGDVLLEPKEGGGDGRGEVGGCVDEEGDVGVV